MMTNAAAELAATRKIPVVLTVKDAVHKIKEDCPNTRSRSIISVSSFGTAFCRT